MKIILASSSKYRQALLAKTGLKFEFIKPDIDEETLKNILITQNKSPLEIAEALSKNKGIHLAKKYPEAVVISGDQLVNFNNEIIGKPYSQEKAIQQLTRLNNSEHQLITATTIFFNSKTYHDNNITRFKMKNLSVSEIKTYVELDNPIDCAGSCKIESRGICLFEKIECSDFTAIEGLPLIWITNTIKGFGHELFKN